ncbi:MAG TPA: cobyric acid synthase [Thermomicrobiales bacterium]
MGRQPAKTLMIQGTASDVGKSILVAGLCRVMRQDGYHVAPFKAQNMALNAAVTIDGGEIGRSQATQARAARIEPTVEMNPILLKPEAGMRSQVIVRGKVWRTLPWREYYSHRAALLDTIAGSLNSLRDAYDVVLIEGAGSPAEINLKAGDIVNMRVAALADAPVLLVGDIDRGGVFASLLGTLELLEPDERARVRGLLINKFRGDVRLLTPGLEMIAARTGVPVLGVIPHLPRIGLAEEDSVALDRRPDPDAASASEPIIDIAVIRLPQISNFDDFDPLAAEEGVRVRFVRDPAQLGTPDLLIIPGTKSTIADLTALRDAGLDRAIVALARSGTPTIGICGGFQILGETIADPFGVESDEAATVGFGLLPLHTVFARTKTTDRASGTVSADHGLLAGARGLPAIGYEIHMGQTIGALPAALRLRERQGVAVDEPDGAISADGLILGTYMHGFFDNAPLRGTILANLARRKGIAPRDWGRATSSADDPFDRLAAHLREHLDLPRIYAEIGL